MIQKKIQIELFYERDEAGFRNPDGKQYLVGQEDSDVTFVLHSLDECTFKRFKCTKKDYNIEIGSTVVWSFLFESKIAPKYSIACDVSVTLTELDDAARDRLEAMGYDREQALKENLEAGRKQYWNFRCRITEGILDYCVLIGTELNPATDQWIAELRAEEAISLLQNEEYRSWLRDMRSSWDIYAEDIIIGAPIDIRDKKLMLDDFSVLETRCRCRYPDRCDISAVYSDALDYLRIDSPVSAYVLHEKCRTEENGKRAIKSRVLTYRTFSEVLDAIASKYHGNEPDEFDCRWNYVERFDLEDGEYQKTSHYIVSEKGVIWHAAVTTDAIERTQENWPYISAAHHYLSHLDLPVPYERGDILYVDCRPFRAPFYTMILDQTDGEFISSPLCLTHTEEGWALNNLGLFEFSSEAFSCFYRMALCKGNLPKDEQELEFISNAIKADGSIADKLYDFLEDNNPENEKIGLMDFVTELSK